jgi:hypothetical protein
MALIYQAQLVPGKLDLIGPWVLAQPWAVGAQAPFEAVGAYRFDDPTDAVGIEIHLLRSGAGPVIQVPVTYRGAPLAGADGALIGTMQHSVLGQRWVYDGCADPVFVSALSAAILTGGTQAELEVQHDDGLRRREPTTRVIGSGAPSATVPPITSSTVVSDQGATTIQTGALELVLRRDLSVELAQDALPKDNATLTLSGTWPGSDEPVVLATARPQH